MRSVLVSIIFCAAILGPQRLFAADSRFSFQQVVEKAKALAAGPFVDPADKLPDFLKNLTYDQWRDIRFKDDKTLWQKAKEPFTVRFFHLGFYYHQPVTVHYVEGRRAHEVHFSPDLFDYGQNKFQTQIPADLGFAGFRIHYPINDPHYADEIAVFLGASYFRSLAAHQGYGMSARGLGIDTALDTGEEFPFFKEYWISKPHAHDKQIIVYALLDSQSISGAYKFVIRPGTETVMNVDVTLFARKDIQQLEIAPMTSMFLYGENSKLNGYDDLRPEIHDSDGLALVTASGEKVWRPLVNPKDLLVNTFDGTPQAFGLLQRDTNFDHYQDLESRFELRPGVWVLPGKDWGPGHVELVQIPSNDEHNDNIAAFWVPQRPVQAGERRHFSYKLQWCWAKDKLPSEGYVVATRLNHGDQGAKFEVDFEGAALDALPADASLVADISVSQGYSLAGKQLFKNPVTGGWRLVFDIQFDKEGLLKDVVPARRPAVGLRVFLTKDAQRMTETWDYAFLP